MPIRHRKAARKVHRKKVPRKSYAKKNARRQTAGMTQVRSLNWKGSPFPPVLRTRFTYTEDVAITATTGGPGRYVFNMNSLYDPNNTGTGSQPRFYDTLVGANNTGAPYRDYMVYRSHFSLSLFAATDSSATARACIGVGAMVSGTSGASSIHEMVERQDYKHKWLAGMSSGRPFVTLKRSCNVNSVIGVKDLMDANGSKATYNANPTNLGIWVVDIFPIDQVSTVNYTGILKITYDCVLYSRNDVADS